MQKINKELANEGLFKVELCFIDGRQSGNKITYIGGSRNKTGKELPSLYIKRFKVLYRYFQYCLKVLNGIL